MVIAIYQLKKKIRQLSQGRIKAREKLMCVITVLFLAMIFFSIF